MSFFFENNGFIEGFPSSLNPSNHNKLTLVFFVDPFGEFKIIASYETHIIDHIPTIRSFPQTSLPNMNLELLAGKLANTLFLKEIYGYISVDFFVMEGKNYFETIFLAYKIDFFINNFISDFTIFECLMLDGEFDSFNKKYLLEKDQTFSSDFFNKRKERVFAYVEDVIFENLRNVEIRFFFEFCKENSLCFDYEKREGLVFLLENDFSRGKFNFLIIGERKETIFKNFLNSLKILKKKFGGGKNLEILMEKIKRAII